MTGTDAVQPELRKRLEDACTGVLVANATGNPHIQVQAINTLLATAREAAAALAQSLPAGGGEWVLVPKIGAEVMADHPITPLNPAKTFEVSAVQVDSLGARARGEGTCWFGVSLLSPAAPAPQTESRDG